ncbi:hypothetical protein C0581_03715 [Candidatus Parcubacteria bacterium]|nr:MAG: hypothetical protein C0581_03715 [Candidatus Parcubacteria bacterium]
MSWIFLALFTAFCYGAYNFFIKVSSGHIDQVVGAVVMQGVAFLFGLALLAVSKSVSFSDGLITTRGVWYAVAAGVFVGLAEVLSFFVFSKGLSISIGLPVIIGGSIVFGVLLGLLFLKEMESFSFVHALGLVFVLLGVVLLASK